MIGLIKALGVVKTAAAITVLTAATTFAASQVVLPAASDGGQAHAAAAAANATTNAPAATPDQASGKDVTSLQARLTANKERLLDTLDAVLARIKANPNVNAHARDAIQKLIDRLTAGSTGLDRAMQAVAGQHPSGPPQAEPSLPPQAQASLPPQAVEHPTATDHPGKP